MKKLLTCTVLLLAALCGTAQQDPMFSQYMFNPLMANPAYAGSRQAVSATLLHRSQWVGFDGAPTTSTLGIHAPINKRKIALGGLVINDRIGPVNTFGAFGVYAYKLQLGKGKLAFGLKGGMYNFAFDQSLINYQDQLDPLNQSGVISRTVPSFDFGMYYSTHKSYIGAAITHLTKEAFRLKVPELESRSVLRRHFTMTAGQAIPVNRNVVLRPSLYVRSLGAELVNADVNFSVLFNKKLWLGASYRSSKDLILLAEFNLSRRFRFGYSYDILLSQLRTQSAGTHEVFIGFDFDLSKNKFYSPRYF